MSCMKKEKALTKTQVQVNRAEMLEILFALLLIAGIIYLMWHSY